MFCSCNNDDEKSSIANKTITFGEMLNMYEIGNIEKMKRICRSAGYGKIKDTSTYQNQVCIYRKVVKDTYYIICIYAIRDSLYQFNQYIVHNDRNILLNKFKSLTDTINDIYPSGFQNSSIFYYTSNEEDKYWDYYPQYQFFKSKLNSLDINNISNAGVYYMITSSQRSITFEYTNNRINYTNYAIDLMNKGDKMLNLQISGPSYKND